MTTIWLICVLVQIAFWGLYARPFRRRQTPKGAGQPFVSVVVAARNEGANLQKHLPFLAQQNYSNYEIIVIDDDSTDETAAVLALFQQQYPHLRVLHLSPKKELGKKAALSQGIEMARGEWILLTDADCQPASEQWISRMVECIDTNTEIVLGYSPYRHYGGSWLNRWIRFETNQTAIQYLSAAQAGNAYMGVGRNLMYSKALFERVGGFAAHAHLPSGDDDLLVNHAANEQNVQVCLDKEAFVWSEPKQTWQALLRQKQRHAAVGSYYHWRHKLLLGALALSHALFYLGILVLPWLVGDEWIMLLFGVLLRQLVWLLAWWGWLQKLNEKKFLFTACFLDIFVPIYYIYLSFALRRPKIKEW